MPDRRNATPPYCHNCHRPQKPYAHYCHHCGQRHRGLRITAWELTREFFSTLLNLDSKAWRTPLVLVFKPGKLTREFWAGRIKRYTPPIRLFLIASLVYFATQGYIVNQATDTLVEDESRRTVRRVVLGQIQHQLDTLRDELALTYPEGAVGPIIDSVRHTIVPDTIADSMSITVSILNIDNDGVALENGDNIRLGGNSSVRVALADVVRYSPREMADRYEVEGFWRRLYFQQHLRIMLHNDRIPVFLLQQFSWVVLIMVPILALILKLLYIRRKRYFTEHLLLSLNFHSASFIFMWSLLVMAYYEVFERYEGLVSVPILLALVHSYLMLKRVYRQSWWKTLLKYIMAFMLYTFIVIFVMILVLLVSIALFH